MKKRGLFCFVILVAAALAIFLFFCFQSPIGFRVVFFNVGQGDSALINFSDGERMLVDCGPDRTVLQKLGKYLPFSDRRLDYLVVTHPDSDHYAGCVDVLRRYAVKNIITNGVVKSGDQFFTQWQKQVNAEGANRIVVAGFKNMVISSATLEFISPDSGLNIPDNKQDSNNTSIVFRLRYASNSFLFMGDAEIPTEGALVAHYCSSTPVNCPVLHADYLKVGHHGSDSSSGDEFIRAVAPTVAIVSVGKNNFGHPSLRVLNHLERALVDIWRTDKKGDILIGDLFRKIVLISRKTKILIVSVIMILSLFFWRVNIVVASNIDSDSDNLSDDIELKLGTDPNNPDSDGDGYKDGEEVYSGHNPLNAKKGDRKVSRRVEVNLSTQQMDYFFNDVKIGTMFVSTGRLNAKTPTGEFKFIKKVPIKTYRTVTGGSYPNAKWNILFEAKRGLYLHGAFWHNDFGVRPRSGGCVNLSTADAARIYKFLDVGDKIKIVGKTPTKPLKKAKVANSS